MTIEKRFALNLDSVAGLVTGFLLLAITLVILIGNQLGIRVTAQLPENNSVGPYETITFVFSEPVDGLLTLGNFYIQPEIKAKFEWVDSKTLRFIPLQPFAPDTEYTLALAPGQVTVSGRQIKKPQNWKFQTRSPQVAYLATKDGTSQLLAVDVKSGKTTPLTDNTFKILNFDTSENGEFVVFAAFNEPGGIDLWRVQRTGGSAILLLGCGVDRCSVPAISPDGRFVAYVRESAGPTPDLPYGSPRIWIFNIQTREDAPLYEDQQIIGYGPTWSPDGTRLSSYDGIKDEIRLLDLVTSEQMIIPSETGNPVTWSGDGSIFAYTDVEINEFGLHARVREANISIGEITTLIGENDERDYAYNALAWSPIDDKLVVGLRLNADDPSTALWLMSTFALDGQVIAEQPNYVYNNPIWDLWGTALVFQQFKLKGVYQPEIGLWMPGMQEPRILAEGVMPQWLP